MSSLRPAPAGAAAGQRPGRAWGGRKATGWAFICPPARSTSSPTTPCCPWGPSVVNLNPMYTPDELKRIIVGHRDHDPDHVRYGPAPTSCTSARTWPSLGSWSPGSRTTSRAYPAAPPADLDCRGLAPFLPIDRRNCYPNPGAAGAILPNDPALIQFTGGTTGIPKGAVLTHGNIVAATIQLSVLGRSDHRDHPRRNGGRSWRFCLIFTSTGRLSA